MPYSRLFYGKPSMSLVNRRREDVLLIEYSLNFVLLPGLEGWLFTLAYSFLVESNVQLIIVRAISCEVQIAATDMVPSHATLLPH